jgi:hypothetical protein
MPARNPLRLGEDVMRDLTAVELQAVGGGRMAPAPTKSPRFLTRCRSLCRHLWAANKAPRLGGMVCKGAAVKWKHRGLNLLPKTAPLM